MLEYICTFSILSSFSSYTGRRKIIADSRLWYRFFFENYSRIFVTNRSSDTTEVYLFYGGKTHKKIYICHVKYNIALEPGYQ